MSPADAADAAVGPNAGNHLATSWQMYEPTWLANYQLLEQILNGGETNLSNHGDPVTTVAGPNRGPTRLTLLLCCHSVR